MKTYDIARRAARSLKNAKARTILTSLAIGVGAFTIAISLAAGEGARQYADKLISSNVNPQMLVIFRDKTIVEGGMQQAGLTVYDPDSGSLGSGMTIKQMTQADVDKLADHKDIAMVTPTYMPQVQFMQFGSSDKKFSADVTTYDPTIITETSQGKLPAMGKEIADNQAAIPESFVDVLIKQGVIKNSSEVIGLKLSLSAVQSTVVPSSDEISQAYMTGGQDAVQALMKGEVKSFDFTVVAVTKRSATAFTGSSAIQISANSARAISEFTTKGTEAYQKYFGATALAKPGVDTEALKQDLQKEGFYSQTAKDLQGIIFTIVNTLQGIVLGFGVVALIASVFGIINTQYISVLERTREIGLMKALGMRGRGVSRLFQFEAAWIGFLGGIIGSAVAVVAGTLLNPWITETLSLGEGNSILIFQAVPIIVMIIALMLIAMLAGWFPARKAAKLDPIEALRTE